MVCKNCSWTVIATRTFHRVATSLEIEKNITSCRHAGRKPEGLQQADGGQPALRQRQHVPGHHPRAVPRVEYREVHGDVPTLEPQHTNQCQPKKEHGFANSVEHLARARAVGLTRRWWAGRGRTGTAWAARARACTARGWRRPAPPLPPTPRRSPATSSSQKRVSYSTQSWVSQPRPCTRPRRRNRERNTTAYGTAAPAAAVGGGGAWVAFLPWECGFSPPPPFASLHPHGLWCFFNLTPGFCSYWKMGVPREKFFIF